MKFSFFFLKLFLFKRNYFNFSIRKIIQYFFTLVMELHDSISLSGFFVFITMFIQVLTGVFLALGFIPESMYIPMSREVEDLENLYIDDIFFLHERGVDFLFIFLYLHLFRKIYINNYLIDTEISWKSGALLFLIFQVVVFFGLTLCGTHLSDITLRIAANILHTFFLFKGKVYWLIFTDKTLNTDTMIRLALIHYILGVILLILSISHGIDMHYNWKNKDLVSGILNKINWFEEGLINELLKYSWILCYLFLLSSYLFSIEEALSYEMFMWGDIGFVNDVNFLAVAPHWYFRPFMAWLTACPNHYLGLLGLFYFFLVIYFQPNIMNIYQLNFFKDNYLIYSFYNYNKFLYSKNNISTISSYNFFFNFFYYIFIISIFYVSSFLPFGRFFNEIGGNNGLLLSYIYISFYLGNSFFRKNYLFKFKLI